MDDIIRLPESYPWIQILVDATSADISTAISDSEWPYGYRVLPNLDDSNWFIVMLQVPWHRDDQWMIADVGVGQWFGVIPTEVMVGDIRDVRLVTWTGGTPNRMNTYPMPPGYAWTTVDQDNE